ncbi:MULTISPECIES: hypothetical protein [unclassified Microbulbifer]|uniref:hypothetical protein n=1 Tax=unclassified Microbulbifer TaxID=2619833 RepID=UPI0027E4D5FF|nr:MULTISPECIES: hypothetical protein [unclassified Microbulbifer]
MSWSKVNMAAGACWGILAHHEVAQLNPELTPFAGAGSFPISMLHYFNPHASTAHREVKASNLAEKFIAYLFHFYRPGFERVVPDGGHAQLLKQLNTAVYEVFFQPEGKTLDDLAVLLDEQLMFADEVQEA